MSIIQTNARVAAAEIARHVGMAPSAVFERLRKLEERGVIRGYTASVDPGVVGLGLLAFVLVGAREASPRNEIGEALAAVPGVQEVHHIAGADDYIVKIRAASPEDLGHVLREKFRAIPGLRHTRTTIVLETVKESAIVPLDRAEVKGTKSGGAGKEGAPWSSGPSHSAPSVGGPTTRARGASSGARPSGSRRAKSSGPRGSKPSV